MQVHTGLPPAEQVLTYAGSLLCNDAAPLHSVRGAGGGAQLSAGATLSCALRLAGGKGGFGALLRGMGRDGKVGGGALSCTC